MLPALVVFLCSLVFLPCVAYSEWYIDELFAAVRNADARGETPLREVLSHDFWGNNLWDGGYTHKSYRPLVVLSYAWQYAFNSALIRPQPLRAFNVALHSTNALLLYRLLRRFRLSWHWACIAASLFAAHPVHCENIVYLVGRADALATFCWLVAMLVWLRPRRASAGVCSWLLRVLLVTLLAVVGGLCKETGFLVLPQLAAAELLGRRPVRGAASLLAAFGIVYYGRSLLTDGTQVGFSYVDTPVQYNSDPMVRLCTYLYFHGKYAQLLVLPWTLSWDYSHNALPVLHEASGDARMLLVLGAYLGVAASASWAFAMRKRGMLLGLSNVLIPFVPASNLFFHVGTTIGERLLYTCDVGGALLLAASCGGAASAAGRGQPVRRSCCGRCRFALGFLLLCLYLWLCSLRVYQWSSKQTLFGPDADSYPRSTKTRHQYGTVLHRDGRFDEALIHYQASLEVFPQSALTEYCLAQIYLETGRSAEALQHFENIFAGYRLGFGRFNMYALYVDYGFTLMMLRRFEEAIPNMQQGLSMNEDVPHGLNGLGYSFMQLGRRDEARAAFERGLHYDPENAYLLNNLGVADMFAGSLERGADHLSRAVQLEPGVPTFLHNVQLLRIMVERNSWPQEQFMLDLFYHRGT